MGRNYLNHTDNLESILKNYIGDKITSSSLKAYANSLRNIFKLLDAEHSTEPLLNFENVKNILINKGYQLNTIKNKISSIITFLRANNSDEKINDICNLYGFRCSCLPTKNREKYFS